MAKPKVLVLTGHGINCDEETRFAFQTAGASADIVHVNDLFGGGRKLEGYDILAFPGGFSYGDDTGSGKALANLIRNNLWENVLEFVEGNHLVIGICNGFQVLANLGLLPALEGKYGEPQAALTANDSARYVDRWVDLKVEGKSPWLKGISQLSVPIAHGEGRFYGEESVLNKLEEKGLVALRYVQGEACAYQELPANPNGALRDIAGVTDESGRVLGLMPHPERALAFTHLPNWLLLKEQYRRQGKPLPTEGPGLQVFRNAVQYFT